PVVLASSPSSISVLSPNKIAPTSVSSRLSARPYTPLGNSIISLSITSLNPSTRATPSPVSRTIPTLLLVVDVFRSSIFDSISSSMVLMVLNFTVRVEGVRDGYERCRPRHHFQRGSAFRQEAGDQREIRSPGRCHICFSDLPQSLSVSRDPFRLRFQLKHCAFQARAGASAYSFLKRRCNCVTFASRANRPAKRFCRAQADHQRNLPEASCARVDEFPC